MRYEPRPGQLMVDSHDESHLRRTMHAAILPVAIAIAAACLVPQRVAAAQSPLTRNTLARDSTATPPRATLHDVQWLAGHWRGPSLGGTSEEIWAAPFGGSMLGSYKLVRGDSVVFYEILSLVEEDASLVLRLKHFDAGLAGWEEKGEVVRFPLVRITPDAAYFEGMTMRRLGPDRLQVFVAFRTDDGRMREEEFPYARVRPALEAPPDRIPGRDP
jgi:hypothetical protein